MLGSTFVAHVRYASTGAHTLENTHPFLQDGRLFAHNGMVQGLDGLDRRLALLNAAQPHIGGFAVTAPYPEGCRGEPLSFSPGWGLSAGVSCFHTLIQWL